MASGELQGSLDSAAWWNIKWWAQMDIVGQYFDGKNVLAFWW